MHEELFVCVAVQLGFLVHSLHPCLLDYFGATLRFCFVKGGDCGEVDWFIDMVLQGWRDVVGMVVRRAL